MRLTTRQTGIVSYAGLDEEALWAAARRAFAQPPVPERFCAFLPLFPMELVQNMSYGAPNGTRKVSAQGFSTDSAEYHRKLYEERPDLYVGDNRRRNIDREGRFRAGGVVTVDEAWAESFPQYRPFLGEKLALHLIGGGHQAVAVPESLFPRGGGVLLAVERQMRVTARCEHFVAYMKARMRSGERYDPVRFELDYLAQNNLKSVCVLQKQLSQAMQELSILQDPQGLRRDLYTQTAQHAQRIPQYVPFSRACDLFEDSSLSRTTARLLQVFYSTDEEFQSDFWIPYQDACAYVDKRGMTLDVRALCEGFQIAPAYDPETGGGLYPDRVRVAVVRDRNLKPLAADVLNNPAYGSGVGPMGMVGKLVYLPDSRECLRSGRMAQENVRLACVNTRVAPDRYHRMLRQAERQEQKGLLLDALYRRKSALGQLDPTQSGYREARKALDACVERCETLLARDRSGLERAQANGYDADIDYLRRASAPLSQGEAPFMPDALREASVECGYAMRGRVCTADAEALALREPPQTPPVEAQAEEAPTAAESQTAQAPFERPRRRFSPCPIVSARRPKAPGFTTGQSLPRCEQMDMFAALEAAACPSEAAAKRLTMEVLNPQGKSQFPKMTELLKHDED